MFQFTRSFQTHISEAWRWQVSRVLQGTEARSKEHLLRSLPMWRLYIPEHSKRSIVELISTENPFLHKIIKLYKIIKYEKSMTPILSWKSSNTYKFIWSKFLTNSSSQKFTTSKQSIKRKSSWRYSGSCLKKAQLKIQGNRKSTGVHKDTLESKPVQVDHWNPWKPTC